MDDDARADSRLRARLRRRTQRRGRSGNRRLDNVDDLRWRSGSCQRGWRGGGSEEGGSGGAGGDPNVVIPPSLSATQGSDFERAPAIAAIADTVIAVWESHSDIGRIAYRFSHDGGATWDAIVTMDAYGDQDVQPHVAAAPDGSFWLTHLHQDLNGDDVVGSDMLTWRAAPGATTFSIVTGALSGQHPHVHVMADGTVLLASTAGVAREGPYNQWGTTVATSSEQPGGPPMKCSACRLEAGWTIATLRRPQSWVREANKHRAGRYCRS